MARPRKTSPSRELEQLHESRRRFLRNAAAVGFAVALGPSALSRSAHAVAVPIADDASPNSGPLPSWQSGQSLPFGTVNLATGNAHFSHAVCGWGGKGGGLSFGLAFNSQSARTGALGPKWTHGFAAKIIGTSPAVVVSGDGGETSFSLVNGQYVAPASVWDTLVRNADSSWTLTRKDGMLLQFGSDGLLRQIVDTNGNTLVCTWSGGVLTQIQDAAGRNLTLGYAGGKISSVTDFEGRVWTLTYDGAGRLLRVTDPPLAGQTVWTQFAYDSGGNVSQMTDRLGLAWAFAYSANVFTGMTAPDAKTVSVSIGNTPTGAWPADVASVSSATDAANAQAMYGFDSQKRLVAVQGVTDNRAVFGYDASHNRTSQQLDSGATWSWGYDSRGNALTHTDPLSLTTTNTYDTGNRLLTTRDPLNQLTSYGYDSRGNVTSVSDPTTNTTQHAYGTWGQLTQTTDPRGFVTTYGYNATTGDQTSVTDPLGNQTLFQYVNGRVTQRTDARNRVTTYAYDASGRQTGITYPTSSPVSLSYDALGRLTGSTDGTGTRTYSYDMWGRKVGMTDPMGNTNATYDGAGKMLTQSDVSGRTHTYGYDTSTRLSSVGDGAGAVSYTYTADGRPATALYPNGTKATYGYDVAGRVTSLAHTKVSDNSILVSYAAVYNNAGRLTQVTEQPSGAVITYTYDNAGRLLGEARVGDRPYSGSYTYDASGNRLTAKTITNGVTTHDGTYTYDSAGRLTQVVDAVTSTTEVYSWNNDGTLASYPGPGYTRRLEYDEEQRLIRIQKDFGGGNIQTAYEYGYGADGGRRWRKDYAGNAWTWFPCGVACCAGELVEKQSDLTGNSWTVSAQMLRGTELIQKNQDCVHFDILGNVSLATNQNAVVAANILYDAYSTQRYSLPANQEQWQSVQAESAKFVGTTTKGYLRSKAYKGGVSTIGIAIGAIRAVYGKYCGPQTEAGKGTPVNALDRCCMNHDNCWGLYKCNVTNGFYRNECVACNWGLCSCAKNITCRSAICVAILIGLRTSMCPNLIIVAPTVQPPYF